MNYISHKLASSETCVPLLFGVPMISSYNDTLPKLRPC